MGAMRKNGSIGMKLGTYVKVYRKQTRTKFQFITHIFKRVMCLNPYSGRTFVWGLGEIMDRSLPVSIDFVPMSK